MRTQVLDWIYFNLTAETWQYTLYFTTGLDVLGLLLVAVLVSLQKHHQAHMQFWNHAGCCVAYHLEANNTKKFYLVSTQH